jgi:hypothetical protein
MPVYRLQPPPKPGPLGVRPCVSTTRIRHGSSAADSARTWCGQVISNEPAPANLTFSVDCKSCARQALQR